MGELFDLYSSGNHERVWGMMNNLNLSAPAPAELEDVLAVAHETMRRAAHNLELIVSRLQTIGFEFAEDTSFRRSTSAERGLIETLNARLGGNIPISIQAWYSHIGVIDLRGRLEGLCSVMDDSEEATAVDVDDPVVLSDPIVIAPAEKLVQDYEDWSGGLWGDQPFKLELSPDALHKAGISGGSYDMSLAVPCADAIFLDQYRENFVDYLRRVCRWGGFPGWSEYADVPERILSLREGLLTF